MTPVASASASGWVLVIVGVILIGLLGSCVVSSVLKRSARSETASPDSGVNALSGPQSDDWRQGAAPAGHEG